MISWLFFLPFLLPGKVVVADGACPPGFNDTLPSGRKINRCYHVSNETMDHRRCMQYCFEKDSYLAEPVDVHQFNDINVITRKVESAYLGAIRKNNDRTKLTWKRSGNDHDTKRKVPHDQEKSKNPHLNIWDNDPQTHTLKKICLHCPIFKREEILVVHDDYNETLPSYHLNSSRDCTKTHLCLCQSPPRVGCHTRRSACSEPFECKDSVCVCKKGFYLNFNTDKCHRKKNIGELCPTGERECRSGFSCPRGTCVKTGTTGHNQTCGETSDCEATLNCTETDAGKKCQCKWHSDYNGADKQCKPKNDGKLYGEECIHDDQCVDNAGYCRCDNTTITSTKTCFCKDGYTYDEVKGECSCPLGEHTQFGQCACKNAYEKTADGKCQLKCAGGDHKLSPDGKSCVCKNDEHEENNEKKCVPKNAIAVNKELGKGDGANRDNVINALDGIVPGTKDSPDEEKNIIFDELKILRDNKVGNLTETEIKTALEGIIQAVIEINENVDGDIFEALAKVVDESTIDQARLTDYRNELKKNKIAGKYLTSEEIQRIIMKVNAKPEPKSDPPYALIIGGIVGGIVVIGGVGIVMRKYVCPKKKKKRKKKKNADGTEGTESMVSGMSQASGSTVSSVKTGSPPGSDTSSVKSGSVRRESVESVSTQDTLDSQDNGSGRRDSDTGSQDSGGSGGSGGSVESGGSDRSKGSQV